MAFTIGFTAEQKKRQAQSTAETANAAANEIPAPRKSVVRVGFLGKRITLSYYNDLFDLHCGDKVYVEGKYEGVLGEVLEVNYNFKIKISDYKKVIAAVDTAVTGQQYMTDSHFITFEHAVLPVNKILLWFKPPRKEEEKILSGSDDSFFRLDDLKNMRIDSAAAERGCGYYSENRVRYVCLDGAHGYAIVEGGEAYEAEFEYRDGKISGLVCSCFCCNACKHEFAAMLQLKELLDKIGKQYSVQYEQSNYFAAVCKGTLFDFAMGGRENGGITLFEEKQANG